MGLYSTRGMSTHSRWPKANHRAESENERKARLLLEGLIWGRDRARGAPTRTRVTALRSAGMVNPVDLVRQLFADGILTSEMLVKADLPSSPDYI